MQIWCSTWSCVYKCKRLPFPLCFAASCGRLPSFCTRQRGQQDLVVDVLSLSPVRSSPLSIKGDALSPNTKGFTHDPNNKRSIRHPLALDTLKLHRAHARILSARRSSRHSRPFNPESDRTSCTPILLPLVCNPTANFKHLGSGIKSPTDSN